MCSSGMTCASGQCACAAGQALCGGQCVDTRASATNCGSCGTTCGLGTGCSAGSCVPGAASATDSCGGLAGGVSLSQIAVYQTVEVPVMKDGAALAPAARNTDVVAGKAAVFRVFVTASAGFTARTLSARVFVQSQGAVTSYFEKKRIAGSSQPADLATTFQITVPQDKVATDATYAVEVVECGAAPSGMASASAARFPAKDGAPLGARRTGGLKIQLVPLRANNLLPDTSAAALAKYEAMLLAVYPITSVEFTVGDVLAVSDDQDWNGMLDQVRARRLADAPEDGVYYYGMLKPTATFAQYCGQGCVAGVGFVPQGTPAQVVSQRCALGLAYGDQESAETMVHEVAHNHGRNHAPCPSQGIDGVDPNYPYPQARVGVYGWDARSRSLMAPTRTDIMGYCDTRWISDYTYDGILNRVAAVNNAKVLSSSEPLALFRVLLLDARGPRWGAPIDVPSAPAGTPEPAEILDAGGAVIASVVVYRSTVSEIHASSVQIPAPKPGWHAVRVAGAPPMVFAP